MNWLRAVPFALAVVASASAGCGTPPHLTMQVIAANSNTLDISIGNTGDASTRPLTLSLDAAGVFFVDLDMCSGRVLGSGERCGVRLGFPLSTVDQPEGSLAADDGHGAHASTTLTATKAFAKLTVDGELGGRVDVREGETADATLWINNSGQVETGPLTLDFAAKLVNDQCTGATLAPGRGCSFQVEYSPPIDHMPKLLRLSGTASANPGGSVAADAYFNVLGLLYMAGPNFGIGETPGDTVYRQIGNQSEATPIGPLQLSFEHATGTPPIDYPPFYLVAGQDMCSGQTLQGQSSQQRDCGLVIGLDPRLPAGGTYRATFHIDGGDEKLDVEISATRNNQQ